MQEMSSMKKLIALFVITGCLMVLSGCGSSVPAGKETDDLSPLPGQTLIDQISEEIKNVFDN